MGRIEFDFYTTNKQANRLAEIAKEIEKLSTDKMNTTLQQLAYDWKSRTSSEFLAKGNVVQRKIQEI